MSIESIRKSSVLTPFQKQVEEKLFTSAFDRQEQEKIFRLLFKFVDKCNSIKHWVNDAYLNSLIKESEQFL
jgi:hypothetical protein